MTDAQNSQLDEMPELINTTIAGNPKKPRGEAGKLMLERMNAHHAEVTQWALQHFSYRPSDAILDIGCGGGAALRSMAAHIETGHLVGVDYSEVAVEISKQTNADHITSGKISVVSGSVDALPFDDERFDKAVTIESFYFWPHPVENLREVLRVLKPGGVFLLVADIYQKDDLCQQDIDNIKMFEMLNPTPEEFSSMMKQAGFFEVIIHTKEGTDWICVEAHRAE